MNNGARSVNQTFLQGYRDMIPFVTIVIPFALLFGTVATEAGFNVAQVMSFSILVIAGSSQFIAVVTMADNAPTFIVLLTSLAVNLRMAMYSAALVPHFGHIPLWKRALMSYGLVDQSFAMSMNKFENEPDMSTPAKLAYYAGGFCFLAPLWFVSTYVGAVLGGQIPKELALDFALPICFIALSAPLIRTLPHAVAAFVSVFCALLFASIPYSLGLIGAGICAMIAGAQTELWMKGRDT